MLGVNVQSCGGCGCGCGGSGRGGDGQARSPELLWFCCLDWMRRARERLPSNRDALQQCVLGIPLYLR